MPLVVRILVGLVAGFAVGLGLAGRSSPLAGATASSLGLLGTLFVNLIRMTVVPLVVSLLVSSIGSAASSRGLARLGGRALVLALALLTAAALGSGLVADRVLTGAGAGRIGAQELAGVSGSEASAQGASSLSAWIVDLVPGNPVKAAADGAILPLIIFSVLFGLALAGVDQARRDAILLVVRGIADAMQTLVSRILVLAPIGVFALAVPVASTLGWSAAGALVLYVGLVVVLTVAASAALLYPLAILTGPMPASRFVEFCAPAQAIAFASRSSLAALPAMLESAERAALPSHATTVLLPLAAAMYHFGAAVAQPVGVVFLAHLYGIALSPLQFASMIVAVVAASFAVPGIPGGSIIAMAPALSAAHVPLEGIGILLAVDAVPDMFRTTANVTGTLALTAMLRAAPGVDAGQSPHGTMIRT